MDIVSLILRAHPERMETLAANLAAIPGTQVHDRSGDGRMVVTIEDTPELPVNEALLRVQQLDHVICATLAYEYHSA